MTILYPIILSMMAKLGMPQWARGVPIHRKLQTSQDILLYTHTIIRRAASANTL